MTKRWMPLEDGNYSGLDVADNGKEIGLYAFDANGLAWPVEHWLDDNIRLCQLEDEGDHGRLYIKNGVAREDCYLVTHDKTKEDAPPCVVMDDDRVKALAWAIARLSTAWGDEDDILRYATLRQLLSEIAGGQGDETA